MIKLADQLTAKTVENILCESKEVKYILGDANPHSENTVAGNLNNLNSEIVKKVVLGNIVGDLSHSWRRSSVEDYIDSKFAEQNARIERLLQAQQERLNSMNGNETVITDVLPEVGTPGIIYIVPGDNSYSEYMWDTSLTVPQFRYLTTFHQPLTDTIPLSGSTNTVHSDGIFKSILMNCSAFDITEYYEGRTYSSLSDALSDVPQDRHIGGLAVKFVNTDSGRYVHYFNTNSGWTTDLTDWQGFVDDSVTVANSDKIAIIGDEYTEGNFNITGKAYINKLSQFSDYVFVNFGKSGDNNLGRLSDIRFGNARFGNIPFTRLKPKYAMMQSWNNDSKIMTYTQFEKCLDNTCRVLKGIGCEPIITSPFFTSDSANKNTAIRTGLKNYARKNGLMYWDIASFADILYPGQQSWYDGFFGAVSQPGTRTNNIESDNYGKYLEYLEKPSKSLKLFRKRNGVMVEDLDSLMFSDNYERAKLFKEIMVGHTAIGDQFVDSVGQNEGITTVEDEYQKLINKENVPFDKYCLISGVLPHRNQNLKNVALRVECDENVEVFVKNRTAEPYPSAMKLSEFQVTPVLEPLVLETDEWVDLGLDSGLLWRKYNIGANSPEGDGLYFSWGNSEGHASNSGYIFSTANYSNTSGSTVTGNLEDSNDAANVVLGNGWRIPSKDDFSELYSGCTWEWTELNGMSGMTFTSKTNGNTIFFPATGFYDDNAINGNNRPTYNKNGVYWSSSLYTSATQNAYVFDILNSYDELIVTPNANSGRYLGLTIRPVAERESLTITPGNVIQQQETNNEPPSVGSVYTCSSDNTNYTVSEVKVENGITKILCTPLVDEGYATNGTLTKVSGNGYDEMTFSYRDIAYSITNIEDDKCGHWVNIGSGDGGVFIVPDSIMHSCIDIDKIDFLISGNTSFNVSDAALYYKGYGGKSYTRREFKFQSNIYNRNEELLPSNTFGNAGWFNETWAITPTASYELDAQYYPEGCESKVTVTNSNKIETTLRPNDTFEAMLEVWCRYFPSIYTNGNSNQITRDSFDYNELFVQIGSNIDTDKLVLSEYVGTAWKIVRFPIQMFAGTEIPIKIYSNNNGIEVVWVSLKSKAGYEEENEIFSVFGNGGWMNDAPWINDDAWNNG